MHLLGNLQKKNADTLTIETFTPTRIFSGNNRSRSFTLSGNSNAAVPAMIGSSNTPNSCPSDWLAIPCASNIGRPPTAAPSCTDRICGGTLAAEVSLQQSTIYSTPIKFSFAVLRVVKYSLKLVPNTYLVHFEIQ